MRELTDRELDAVCGGWGSISFSQSISNSQSNSASVSQAASGWWAKNRSNVEQSNFAINANVIVV
jgi:hypothetical protein